MIPTQERFSQAVTNHPLTVTPDERPPVAVTVLTRRVPQIGDEPGTWTWCSGCHSLTLVSEVTSHPIHDGAGSEPLCPRCAVVVVCDGCRRAVPFGECHVAADDAVLCAECARPPLMDRPRDEHLADKLRHEAEDDRAWAASWDRDWDDDSEVAA